MVKRKSLTLAQARRSLKAFFAQKAGKRRGCGSAHKRRSSKRKSKRRGCGSAHKRRSRRRSSKRKR